MNSTMNRERGCPQPQPAAKTGAPEMFAQSKPDRSAAGEDTRAPFAPRLLISVSPALRAQL